jgi:chemotaxis signal transduction protein
VSESTRTERSLLELRREFDAVFAAPPAEEGTPLVPFLTFRIASIGYALRVLDLAGVLAARKIVPLASRLPGLLGLSAVRGTLLPVYDLGTWLGASEAETPRWFVLCGSPHPVALAFGHFEGHVLLDASERLPASGREGRHVRELVRTGTEVRGVVDLSSLLVAIEEAVAAQGPLKER